MLAATVGLAILNKFNNNQFSSDDSLKGAVLYHSDTFFIIKKTWYCFNWYKIIESGEPCQTSQIKVLPEL